MPRPKKEIKAEVKNIPVENKVLANLDDTFCPCGKIATITSSKGNHFCCLACMSNCGE